MRIAEPAEFGRLIDRLGREVGVRELSRRYGLPIARLSEWRRGQRHAISNRTFALLNTALIDISQECGDAELYVELLHRLCCVTSPPANGTPLQWHVGQPTRRAESSSPVFLEDVLGRTASNGRAIVARLERGEKPVSPSDWPDDLVERQIYVSPKAFAGLSEHWPLFGWESENDAPTVFETARGPRCLIWPMRH